MLDINNVFQFLSIKTKRKIILHLYTCQCEECCVTSLCEKTNSKQANISKHLMDLKEKDIVFYEKNKRKIKYYLNPDFVQKYKPILNFIKDNDNACNCQ